MDVFNTVISAIELTEKIWKAIDNFQKVPERLRLLQVEVKSMQKTLEQAKDPEFQSKIKDNALEGELQEIQRTLETLQQHILQHQPKTGSSVLSRSFRTFKTQLKLDDLNALTAELQKRKASLSLTISMLVLGSVGSVNVILQQHAMTTTTTTKDAQNTVKDNIVPNVHVSRKEFLDSLSAPNYAEDELRVKNPTDGTANWIYDHIEYRSWHESEKSASIHLVGKMGSGKSVLTKSIVKTLKKSAIEPDAKDSAVLFYFCSCVNRVDNSSNILRGFISQLVLEREGLYEATIGTSEMLQARRTAADSAGWSFEALWHLFTKLIQGSNLHHLYCVIDALDECDSSTLDDLLNLLHQLPQDPSMPRLTFKLLFSTREYTHILDCFDSSGNSARLFIHPEIVVSDIRLAMQKDVSNIQKRLKLADDEVVKLQEAILDKSDGMFLWVSLATKDIMDNSYDATYETLEELIEDLPAGLKGLYEKNWVKLIESLPTAKVALANKVLTWVLLAERPLTISELTMALAIDPKARSLPPSKKLLRNLSAFVLNYLAPFVEIITVPDEEKPAESTTASNETEETVPLYKPADRSKVRLVHQSAQEYLLEACQEKRLGMSQSSTSRFDIDLRDGHESLARACLAYLCCEELQLGWIDCENINEWGIYLTTNPTRQKVQERINTHPFLGYAAISWQFHVRKCQMLPRPGESQDESQPCDIFDMTLDFLKNYREGYACSAQIRQLLLWWDGDTHFGPAPPLHCAAAKDLSVIVKRLLSEPNVDLNLRDSEGCTVLHYPALAEESTERPEERLEIIDMILKAGVDINAVTKAGETALHNSAGFPLPSVVKRLIERGISTDIRDKDGMTALNDSTASANKEIIEYLLDAGADVETKDNEGRTPLLKASHGHAWEAIRILVKRGANVNAKTEDGWACLHYASEAGETSMIHFLLDNKADINISTNLQWRPILSTARFDRLDSYKALVERGADVTVTDHDGWGIVLTACEWASLEFIQYLFNSGIDFNVKSQKDLTPLHVAVRRKDMELTQFLIGVGADLKATEIDGFTPFHFALDCESYEIARHMLKFCDNVNERTLDDMTPLSTACGKRTPDLGLIELLLEMGANVNAEEKGNGNMTPLYAAAGVGNTKVIEMLLDNGAVLESLTSYEVRPLAAAAKAGHLEAAKLLVKRGAMVNAGLNPDIGFTALELTCFNGHTEVVKWLINEAGADSSTICWRTLTGDLSWKPSHSEIFQILVSLRGGVDAEDLLGDTLLFCAVWANLFPLVTLALELGADVTKIHRTLKTSVFHVAAAMVNNNQEEMLKTLDERVDPSFTKFLDGNSDTPAVLAATSGQLKKLEHLASIGPPETLQLTSPRQIGEILRFPNYAAILDILSRNDAFNLNLHGSKITDTVLYQICYGPLFADRKDAEEVLTILAQKYKLIVDLKDIVQQTIFQSMMFSRMPKVARALLSNGANWRHRDADGYNVFDLLLYYSKKGNAPSGPPPRQPDAKSGQQTTIGPKNAPNPPVKQSSYFFRRQIQLANCWASHVPMSVPPPPLIRRRNPPIPPPPLLTKSSSRTLNREFPVGVTVPPPPYQEFPTNTESTVAFNNDTGHSTMKQLILDQTEIPTPPPLPTKSMLRGRYLRRLQPPYFPMSAYMHMPWTSVVASSGSVIPTPGRPIRVVSPLPSTPTSSKKSSPVEIVDADPGSPASMASSSSLSSSASSSSESTPSLHKIPRNRPAPPYTPHTLPVVTNFHEQVPPAKFAAEILVHAPDGDIMRDDIGATILHFAAAHGDTEVIEHVLKKNPEIVKDNFGWLPSMVAHRSGHSKLFEQLRTAEEMSIKQAEATDPTEEKKELVQKESSQHTNITGSISFEGKKEKGAMVETTRIDEDPSDNPNQDEYRPSNKVNTKHVCETVAPSRWSSTFKGSLLELGEDGEVALPDSVHCGNIKIKNEQGLEVRMVNRAFSVIADAPIPYQVSEYYFEINVIADPLQTGGIAIGVAKLPQQFSYHLPGWTHHPRFRIYEKSSWGYHANNGFRYPGTRVQSEPFGEPWGVGDTVGCGWSLGDPEKEGEFSNRLWFVKNGKLQGVAFSAVRGPLYPIVGLAGEGIKVKSKFGCEIPEGFKEDLDERLKKRLEQAAKEEEEAAARLTTMNEGKASGSHLGIIELSSSDSETTSSSSDSESAECESGFTKVKQRKKRT